MSGPAKNAIAPKECVLCGEEFSEYGNNPWPLAEEGQCCDYCNRLVMLVRIAALKDVVEIQ